MGMLEAGRIVEIRGSQLDAMWKLSQWWEFLGGWQ